MTLADPMTTPLNISPATSSVDERATVLLKEREKSIAAKTDRIFAALMLLQWIGLVVWALIASRRTWSGTTSTIHPHVWMAIFMGGATSSLPIYLALSRPGALLTRHVIALAQVIFSSLLIHISGGRIETHFHVFGSLAFLAAYRDWRVLIPTTLFVAGDHLIRGIWWPDSVFGVAVSNPWRWLEHAAWVLFEDTFLFVIIRQSRFEMLEAAYRTAELEQSHSEIRDQAIRLNNEHRMKELIIEGALDAVVQMDRTGRVIGWNSQAERTFGWSTAEAIGAPLASLIIPDRYRAAHSNGLRGFESTGGGSAINTRLELEGLRKSGEVFPIELAITPITQGADTTFCAFVRDITDRRRAEDDLRHARDIAEAANQAKSQFLANVSHEIRTPLNGILGFTDVLLRKSGKASESTREEHLRTIKDCGEHLLALINDILDISKIEAGGLELHPVECSPHAVIASVVSVLRVKAREKSISLDYRWIGSIPEAVVSDPGRLRQLLINLVGNAVKFTLQGGVWIDARYLHSDGSPRLSFTIRDTGVGIPADKLQSIFDPFVQVDNSLTRHFEGTGLGLPIARRIARGLGGDVTVQSTLGEGSVFTVTVDAPLADGTRWHDGIASDLVAADQPEAEQEKVVLTGRRALVVEDGETNRALLREFLEEAGLVVESVEEGAAGVRAASQRRFDVILMDMQMPIMDGYTATRELRKAGVSTPIIALTAHAMQGDAEKCLEAGCSDYLSKPIRSEELMHKLADVIRATAPRAVEPSGRAGAPSLPPLEVVQLRSPRSRASDASLPPLARGGRGGGVNGTPAPDSREPRTNQPAPLGNRAPSPFACETHSPFPPGGGRAGDGGDERLGTMLEESMRKGAAMHPASRTAEGPEPSAPPLPPAGEGPGLLGRMGLDSHDSGNPPSEPPNSTTDPAQPRLRSTLPVQNPKFQAIVEKFVIRLEERLDAMDEALAGGEFPRLVEHAHWLKGTGGTAGFGAFTRPAADLELHARESHPDEAAAILTELRALSALIDASPLPTH